MNHRRGCARSRTCVRAAKRTISLSCMNGASKLRIARPTDDIDQLLPFYRTGLGLEIIYRFEDHDGFDGVMLGSKGAPYHFEFTRAHAHPAGRAPSQENLLVFYLSDAAAWSAAVERMRAAGFEPVRAFNPYWERTGATFEDPDGYRIVLNRGDWPA